MYVERAAKASGKQSWTNDVGMFARVCDYRTIDGRRLGEWPLGSITEDTLEAFFGSLSADDSALKRTKVAQRRRRLPLEEEKALLEAAGALTRGAGPRLQWLIIAAIETGCRRGELLALQWADVNLSKRTLLVRATEAGARKTRQSRSLPVSSRLAGVLEMARLDPAGREYPPRAYVFGALGTRLKTVKKAWETAVTGEIEHPPFGHAATPQNEKDLLH